MQKVLFRRPFVDLLASRLKEDSPLIQVILGPRQVGKTTGVLMLENELSPNFYYCTADEALAQSSEWITEQWQASKSMSGNPILIIDEIQKVTHWAIKVKALWDQEKRKKNFFRLVVLGSSSLELMQGLEESLAGRFELIPVHHWSFEESHRQFNFSLDDYLLFGGYPLSAKYIKNFRRWQQYLRGSIIETVVGKDILSQASVRKPSLFRQTFELLAAYPAQLVSYNYFLGQLQERGNIDIVKYYIHLFESAFLFKNLQKYVGSLIRQKASIPKIIPLCPSLYSYRLGSKELLSSEIRGRIFEAAVGAELTKLPGELFYWREGNDEVDFIYVDGKDIFAIEVKSGRKKSARGLQEFIKRHPKAKALFILERNFLEFSRDPDQFMERALT